MKNRLLAFFGIKTSFSSNRKNYFKMFLRTIGLTKPIELSNEEVRLIKLCKLHYREGSKTRDAGKYPSRGEWTETMKPLFNDIYGWNADEFPNDYLDCMFQKLLTIWLKIKYDQSGSEQQLRNIFRASFHKGIARDQEKPIERAIAELCGLIQNNLVIKNGVYRYYLPDDPTVESITSITPETFPI